MKNIKFTVLAFLLIIATVLCSCGKNGGTTAATDEKTEEPTSNITSEPSAEPTSEPTEPPVEDVVDPVGKSLSDDGIPFSFYLIAGEDGLARAAIVDTWNFITSEIVIPEKITYNGHVYPVEQVGVGQNIMLSSPDMLKSVAISPSVKKINSSAFSMCGGLSVITLSEGLEEIGEQAFIGTAVEHLVIPQSVKVIGRSAFSMNPDMKTVTINDGVEVIDERAFGFLSSLEKIEIPRRFEDRISEIFYYCSSVIDGSCEIVYK